jgi:LAO/AO transport system kinase
MTDQPAAAAGADASGKLLERLLNGEPAALAKAITVVENAGAQAAGVLAGIQPRLGRAIVVGVTGPPGAGKSTLVSGLVTELRRRDRTVGILAIDPSSPLSGGAILGDRIRMAEHACDPEVFVRSLASRGHVGGLSSTAGRIVDLMDAAGKDVVIVETVGAGQSDVEVAQLADATVVVCAPGLGDEIQAIKAGILEIADVLVVNKADLPNAERTVSQLQGMLSLRDPSSATVPVIATTATEGRGVAELSDAVEARAEALGGAARSARRLERVRQEIADSAAELVRRQLTDSDDDGLSALCRSVRRGELDPEGAARRYISEHMAKGQGNKA